MCRASGTVRAVKAHGRGQRVCSLSGAPLNSLATRAGRLHSKPCSAGVRPRNPKGTAQPRALARMGHQLGEAAHLGQGPGEEDWVLGGGAGCSQVSEMRTGLEAEGVAKGTRA